MSIPIPLSPPPAYKNPILLVQGIDARPLLRYILELQKKDTTESLLLVGIAKSNFTIPETKVIHIAYKEYTEYNDS